MTFIVLTVTLTSVTSGCCTLWGLLGRFTDVIYCIYINYKTDSSPFVVFLYMAASVLSTHLNE